MLLLLSLVVGYGLVVLYSAVDQSEALFRAQLVRIALAFAVLVVAAYLARNPAHALIHSSGRAIYVACRLLASALQNVETPYNGATRK